jgi:hypothetical protein
MQIYAHEAEYEDNRPAARRDDSLTSGKYRYLRRTEHAGSSGRRVILAYSSNVDLTVVNRWEAENGFSKNRCTPKLTASIALSFEA